MQKPIQRHAVLEHKTVRLYFPAGSYGEYRMRGGIAFPTIHQVGGRTDIQGFVVLSMQDITTKKVSIVEQREFVVIDNILDDHQKITFPGIGAWFNKCFARYYAQLFFWSQDTELAKKYRLEILRSKMITPKPQFVEAPLADEAEARANIWKYIKLGQIIWDAGSTIDADLEKMKIDDKNISPAIHALTVMLAGIDRFPYKGVC